MMQRKRLWMGLLLLSMQTGLLAQGMKKVFTAMPDSIAEVLTETNRADCIDFLENNMRAIIENRIGEQSEMDTITDTYMRMSLSPKVVWEMKLLPANDSTQVVCWIRTVTTPVPESTIHFYTTRWEQLPTKKYWERTAGEQFFLSEKEIVEALGDTLHSETLEALKKEADVTFLRLSLSPENDTLEVAYSTLDFIGKERAEEMKKYLRSEKLFYRWDGDGFILAE